MKQLKIIECDELYDDLLADYGSYGQMFARFFRQFDTDLQVSYFSAIEQALPEPTQDDVFLITGSKAGVYEQHSWIEPLNVWIRQAYQQKARLLGICFGHQILAESLGGKVEKSDKGWGVGVRAIPWLAEPLIDTPELRLIYSHQDQVQHLPDSAEVLLGDEFCPCAAFRVGDRVLGFQGHPEFTPEYTERLLGRRIESIGIERFQQAMQSLEQPTDAERLGKQLLAWLFAA